MKKYLNNICLLPLIILLTGCGFAPHSVDSFPPQLKKVYYQTKNPYEPFEIELKKRLKIAGVTLLASPEKSSLILSVDAHYINPSSNNYNPSSSTQARIYKLGYNATISISDYNNKRVLSPQIVTVSRDVALQPDEVLESTPQIAIAQQEIIRELSIKTMNILTAKKTAETLQKNSE